MNQYFYEVFENIPRQGPGNNESTRKAFFQIQSHLPHQPEILDIGCGKGVQTIELATLSEGRITAVDNHQFFLDCLEKASKERGSKELIRCVNADMTALPFQSASFDLIWSEGAVFIMGIKEGLLEWKKFLKKGGFLVLTDLIWLSDDRPEELTRYWEKECLYVLTLQEVLEAAQKENYSLVAHFTLPEEGWLKEYIVPQEKTIAELKTKYSSISEALETVQAIEFENEIVKKYIGCFGYEFFILRAEK